MKNKIDSEITQASKMFTEARNFKELFVMLNSDRNRNSDYRNAYEEAADFAKRFIETKSKNLWNPEEFTNTLRKKYPNISADFVEALIRCIENYNPVVNIPDAPLWNND